MKGRKLYLGPTCNGGNVDFKMFIIVDIKKANKGALGISLFETANTGPVGMQCGVCCKPSWEGLEGPPTLCHPPTKPLLSPHTD